MSPRPAFPSVDLTNLDLSKLRLPTVDLSNVELPKVDLSKVELPKVDLPKLDLGALPRPEVDTDRLLGFVRDAAYVGIGLTVLAVQQSQVRRRELQQRLSDAVDSVTSRAA